jgi:ABC-type branched-subunit amino acid transport system ATPase component
MSEVRLAFDGVTGGYGTAPVVRDVSGAVAPGQALCVLGRNGTGKTSLMKLLMGYLRCWHGSVRLNGAAIEAFDPPARRRLGITARERPCLIIHRVRHPPLDARCDRGLAFAAYFARFLI